MSGFRYTATFTFEEGEPVAASFDALSTLSTVEAAPDGD